MFDEQTPIVALGAICAIVLFTILPSALIQAHSGRRTWLSCHGLLSIQRRPRSSLLVDAPIAIALITGTQIVMMAAVVSSISGALTRLIGAVELIIFVAWMAYLLGSTRKAPANE